MIKFVLYTFANVCLDSVSMVRFVQQFRFEKRATCNFKRFNGKRPWIARFRQKILEYAYNVFVVKNVLNKFRTSASSRTGAAYRHQRQLPADHYWTDQWGYQHVWDRGFWWESFDGQLWRQKNVWVRHPNY
jgi:hypothetical protein